MTLSQYSVFASVLLLLLVRSMPEYDNSRVLPSSIKTDVGNDVRFDCYSDIDVTWEREDSPLPKKASVLFNSLVFKKTTGSDSGTYICHGSIGNVPFLSKAFLKVLDQTKIEPKLLKVREGETIRITCYTSYSTAQWKFNERSTPNNFYPDGKVAHIRLVQYENQGYYECTGKDEYEVLFYAETKLVVTIRNNFNIYPIRQRVNFGQSARIHCMSDSPVVWHFQGGGLPENTASSVIKSDRLIYVLLITSVRRENSGAYTCEGSVEKKNYNFYALAELVHVNAIRNPVILLRPKRTDMISFPSLTPFYTPNPNAKIPIVHNWPVHSVTLMYGTC